VDPGSLNPDPITDPDPAFQVNPDPVPYLVRLFGADPGRSFSNIKYN
jgi:hypothetical protein